MRKFYRVSGIVAGLIALTLFLVALTTDAIHGYAAAFLWACLTALIFLEMVEDIEP